MDVLIFGILLLALALFGTGLFIIIAAIAILAFYFADISISAVIIELYRLASQPIILAIPLFTFAGYLLAESNTPKRLVALSRAFFGWLPGAPFSERASLPLRVQNRMRVKQLQM